MDSIPNRMGSVTTSPVFSCRVRICFFASSIDKELVFEAIPITFALGYVPTTVANASFKAIKALRSGIFIWSGLRNVGFSARRHNTKWVGQLPRIKGKVAVLPGCNNEPWPSIMPWHPRRPG